MQIALRSNESHRPPAALCLAELHPSRVRMQWHAHFSLDAGSCPLLWQVQRAKASLRAVREQNLSWRPPLGRGVAGSGRFANCQLESSVSSIG